MAKAHPEHGKGLKRGQMTRKMPGMADRAIGAHGLMVLESRVIASGQEKEVVVPGVEHVNHRHVFQGPLIELLDGFGRWNRPFFDVADPFLLRVNGTQSFVLKPVEQVENLREIQGLPGFPTLFTHQCIPVGNGEADYASVRLACFEGEERGRFAPVTPGREHTPFRSPVQILLESCEMSGNMMHESSCISISLMAERAFSKRYAKPL